MFHRDASNTTRTGSWDWVYGVDCRPICALTEYFELYCNRHAFFALDKSRRRSEKSNVSTGYDKIDRIGKARGPVRSSWPASDDIAMCCLLLPRVHRILVAVFWRVQKGSMCIQFWMGNGKWENHPMGCAVVSIDSGMDCAVVSIEGLMVDSLSMMIDVNRC